MTKVLLRAWKTLSDHAVALCGASFALHALLFTTLFLVPPPLDGPIATYLIVIFFGPLRQTVYMAFLAAARKSGKVELETLSAVPRAGLCGQYQLTVVWHALVFFYALLFLPRLPQFLPVIVWLWLGLAIITAPFVFPSLLLAEGESSLGAAIRKASETTCGRWRCISGYLFVFWVLFFLFPPLVQALVSLLLGDGPLAAITGPSLGFGLLYAFHWAVIREWWDTMLKGEECKTEPPGAA